jgi:hypothetical protein
MKQKILFGLMAVVMSGSVFADDADDDQVVTVTVPEVTLLDVDSGASSKATAFTCSIVDDEAGTNFTCTDGATGTDVPYAITTNLAAGSPGTTRKITATATNIDASWKLTVASTPTTGNGTNGTGTGTVTPAALGTDAADIVTAIGNVAASDGKLTYAFGPSDDGAAMAYTVDGMATEITVTYTLGDDVL